MGARFGRRRPARRARWRLARLARFARLARALALGAWLLAQAGASFAAPTVLLISFDGTRPADLEDGELVALARMAREGAHADRLVPVYPANTFPNHVTLVTGVSPERHGIVNNVFVDPERGRYSYDGDPTWLEAEPLWSILAAHGLASVAYYWVGSEGAWRSGRGPADWRPFSTRTRESEKVDQILEWLDPPSGERPSLVTVWFHGADGAAHRHGPGAPEAVETLRVQDAQLGRLLRGLDAKGLWAETTLLVVSDHGMAAVEHSVDLQGALDEAGIAGQVHGGGGFVTVTLDDAEHDVARAVATARGLGLEAWARGEGPPGFESRNPRFGDLVAMAPPGTAISAAGLLGRLRSSLMGGGHGHRPDEPSMAGIFLALGRGVGAGFDPGEVRSLDVAPTVLSLLGLPVPDSMEGRPIPLDAAASPTSDSEGGPN